MPLPSLWAAMTIAGAFWVGVLAARRLRDWGESERALPEGPGSDPMLGQGRAVAALGPAGGSSHRVRERVARSLAARPEFSAAVPNAQRAEALGPRELRAGDIVELSTAFAEHDGDFIVEGVVRLQEGERTEVVVMLVDAARIRWLITAPNEGLYLVEPVRGHGLSGEPPRNLVLDGPPLALERRAQAAAAGQGRHGRPQLPRVGIYLYRGAGSRVAWAERWEQRLFIGVGQEIEAHQARYYPGES